MGLSLQLSAQTPARTAGSDGNGPAAAPAPRPPLPAKPPLDYVIGPDDILSIVFWREKDVSGDVLVRPDGKISLPLFNDVEAAGLTPDELKAKLDERARQFFEEPSATVIVKEIHSRKVFITGEVAKPGTYPLTGPMTVVQLIAMAGGLTEYADRKNISILRVEKGWPTSFPFDYDKVAKRKYLRQVILLKPGDTVIVPQ
jgi:polysaccharide export outer membrane protein